MTDQQEKNSRSSPQQRSELLKFKVPEYEEVEIVLLRDKKGNIVARTSEELSKK